MTEGERTKQGKSKKEKEKEKEINQLGNASAP